MNGYNKRMDCTLLTLIWDVDDVLNDFMRCWFEQWWRPKLGSKLCYEELVSNPPHNILGITLEEYRDSIDGFRLSGLFEEMPPRPELKNWFSEYGHLFRHIALTGVPRLTAAASASWVFRHFGDWIRTFTFIPSERLGQDFPVYDLTKVDRIKWLSKADVFIEDNEANIEEAHKLNIHSFVVSRPWNSSTTKVDEILQELNRMSNNKGVCRISNKSRQND